MRKNIDPSHPLRFAVRIRFMGVRFDPQKASRMAVRHLVGMLSPRDRAAFLAALREVAEEASPEDAAYLALRKIGMTERQARRVIVIAYACGAGGLGRRVIARVGSANLAAQGANHRAARLN